MMRLRMMLISLVAFLAIMPNATFAGGAHVPFFAFRFPERDTAGCYKSLDRHTIDKMNYYNYYAGAEISNCFKYSLNYYMVGFRASSDSTAFWARLDSTYNRFFTTYMEGENWRFPKRINRIKNSRIMDRMLVAHNADNVFCLFVDSLISSSFKNTQAEKDSLAVKLTAEFIFVTDTLFRNWYNIGADSLIIHQLAQEINYHPISTSTGTGDYFSSFRLRAATTLDQFKVYAKIMNSISRKVHDRKSGVITSFDIHLPWTLDDQVIMTEDSTYVDTLLKYIENANMFSCVIHPGDPPSYYTKINNVFYSKLNGRKLGLRYSFAPEGGAHYGFAAQDQMFDYIDNNITNNSYIAFYSPQGLDGKWSSSVSFDPDPHWRALSKLLSKPYLIFIDQFSDWGLDTRLWDATGTVTQNGGEAMLISLGASIKNDTAYAMVGEVQASFDNNGESPNDPPQWHRLAARRSTNDMIAMYTQRQMLHTYVFYDSSGQWKVYGSRHDNIIPSGMNNYKIEWSSDYAYFYLNGAYIDNVRLWWHGHFDSGTKMELATGSDNGTQNMTADSIWATDRDTRLPRVSITGTNVYLNPARAIITYELDCPSYVYVYLENYDLGSGSTLHRTLVQSVDTADVYLPIQASHIFSTLDPTGYYKWLVKAQGHGSTTDSAYGMGFYWNKDSTTILASAKEEKVTIPQLPKAFSLSQNIPNPFNPSTTISYCIPEGKMVDVTLRIYNVRGQLIKSLVDVPRQYPGEYHVFWDGRTAIGETVASGVYFYRLQAGDYVKTRKMVILK